MFFLYTRTKIWLTSSIGITDQSTNQIVYLSEPLKLVDS